jgi:predicted ATPase/class 3 adenylate cyclase
MATAGAHSGRLPAGNVTFVFTDVEDSTGLFRRLGGRFPALLEEQRRLIRTAVLAREGSEVNTAGDGLFLAFADAAQAVAACVDAQLTIDAFPWPADGRLQVRMGVHTGVAVPAGEVDYISLAVHQTARIASAAHGGQVLLSEATVNLVRDVLPDGISLVDCGRFRLAGFDEAERLYQLCHPRLERSFPGLRVASAAMLNVPAQLTSFVGRAGEVVEIGKLLDDHRLVTLTGPGGVGKTRLAVRVASEAADRFGDGAWLVDLAAASQGEEVTAAVASAVGVRQAGARPLAESLADFLSGGETLLVVDNCEHVIDAAAGLVERLLVAAAGLKILATSRERLRVPGEVTWLVHPLEIPGPHAGTEDLLGCEATRLFIERASEVRPDLTVDPDTAAVTGRIVRLLDGLPLAIELAAARTALLSPAEILEGLDRRLRLLTSGSRTAGARQQTLEATLDWSYDLLSRLERAVLRRLSVFAGGFNLDAAMSVTGFGELGDTDVAPLVWDLAEKSLVTVGEPGRLPTRYRLLETTREYATGQLAKSGERRECEQAYTAYYVELARASESELTGPGQGGRVAMLQDEHDNLRNTIMLLGADPENAVDVLRILAALRRYWIIRGDYGEWLGLAQPLLQRNDSEIPLAVRAQAFTAACWLGSNFDPPGSRHWSEEAVAIGQSLGQPRLESEAYFALAVNELYGGGTNETLADTALHLAEQVGDRTLVGQALQIGAVAGVPGNVDLEVCLRRNEEALEVVRANGDSLFEVYTLANFAYIYLLLGEPSAPPDQTQEAVLRYSQEALAIADALGYGQPMVCGAVGLMLLKQGRTQESVPYLARALKLGRKYSVRDTLAGVGGIIDLAVAVEDWSRAARLLGYYDTAHIAAGLGGHRPSFEKLVSKIRQPLGEAYDALYAEGATLRLDAALALADLLVHEMQEIGISTA